MCDHEEKCHSGTDDVHRDIPASFLCGRAGHYTQIMGWRVLEEGRGAPGSAAVTWMERLRAMLLNPFL